MRKMAKIVQIESIDPIDGADAIEVASYLGWKTVVKKGEFSVGDLAVACEIDSFIPHWLAPFLSKGKEPREYNGVKGERLRTVKLKGQISQGLLLPLDVVGWDFAVRMEVEDPVGLDVTELLGIQKWEAPVNAQLAGLVKGNFPGYLPKTDQSRVQNLVSEFDEWAHSDLTWEATEKLDGSSMTVYVSSSDSGCCSRNLELTRDENNTLWKVAIQENLLEKIQSTGRHLALQGELIGEGIQSNKYKIKDHKFFVFDIFDIDNARYMRPSERVEFCAVHSINHVPVIETDLMFGYADTVELVLEMVEGKSKLNAQTEREGLVFKCNEKNVSFKGISNKFLLKNGDE